MRNKIFLLALNLFFAAQIKGQDIGSFKRDSTNLANQKVLLDLQKQVLDLNQSINNLPNQSKSSELKDQIENVKAIQGLFGDSKPTALSGNISITDGKTSTAETRKLVFDLLNTNVDAIKKDIDGAHKDNIIITFPAYYNGIPQYFSAKKGLDDIKVKFDKFKTNITGGGVPAAAVAAIAAGITVINAVTQLATLFRTDTQILVNDEVIDEATIVAKLSKGSTLHYYYPSIYPMNLSKFNTSDMLTVIHQIEGVRLDILDVLSTKRKALETAQDAVVKKNKEINDKKIALSNLPSPSGNAAKVIKKEIAQKELELKNLQDNEKFASNIVDRDSKQFEKIETEFSDVKTKLETIIDKDSNFSALSLFVRIEGILKTIGSNTATLVLSAKAKGTNKITKFLWSSSLKTSASIEISYLLLDHDGEIVASDAFTDYKTIKNQ